MNDKILNLAVHLPQFHPIPENDEWWGRGFTEWTNVARAKQLFGGHDQPRIPSDLGFYDLRLPEARQAQAELAREYGIDGFCYYHYWFNGRRLLDRPVRDILHSQRPDFPFCLFWANETWSRRWLGEERDILMAQTYSEEDNVLHARYLAAVFRDERYVRVDGRPLFVIYRPTHILVLKHFLEQLRRESDAAGCGNPFILGCSSWAEGTDMRSHGMDGTFDFQPKLGFLPEAFADENSPERLARNQALGVESGTLRIYDAVEFRRKIDAFRDDLEYPVYPSVFVGWDNTPRRGEKGIIVVNNTPESFGQSLENARRYLRSGKIPGEKVMFINAWNEWAEGNHLEPDFSQQYEFLEQVNPSLAVKKAPRVDFNTTREFLYENRGWCPICEKDTVFTAQNDWLRDHYLCAGCGSIPRERALMHVIQTRYPNWRELRIHESSPGDRGASVKLREQCRNYVTSQCDPEIPFGSTHPTKGYRSEDLEKQSFGDQEFDLVISQDVMEHVFDPEAAFREIHRTLRPGGAHIFTAPLQNKGGGSQRRAEKTPDGTVRHLFPAEYHGNPLSATGSLVVWHYGFDIKDIVATSCTCHAEVLACSDPKMGIEGEYLEVVIQTRA